MDDNSCATDVTRSDVFHSIINSPLEDDRTIRSDLEDVDDEDVTLDIDTPDDMEESILERECSESYFLPRKLHAELILSFLFLLITQNWNPLLQRRWLREFRNCRRKRKWRTKGGGNHSESVPMTFILTLKPSSPTVVSSRMEATSMLRKKLP